MSLIKSMLRVQNEHVVQLQNELFELRADKERLDWINENRPKLDKWRDQFFVGSKFTRKGHKDIRKAIDEARRVASAKYFDSPNL